MPEANKGLIKSVTKEIKSVNDKGEIEFVFSALNVKDSDNDIVRPGAFKKTINENTNRIFWNLNHNKYLRPGVIVDMYEEGNAVYAKVKANLNIPLGVEVFEQEKFFLENKQPLEHSYKYDVIKSSKNQDGSQNLHELKLYEVSSLYCHGANEFTPTLGVKELNKTIEARLAMLEKALKEMGGAMIDGGEGEDSSMVECPNCGELFDYNSEQEDTLQSDVLEFARWMIRNEAYGEARRQVNLMFPEIAATVEQIFAGASAKSMNDIVNFVRCKKCGRPVTKACKPKKSLNNIQPVDTTIKVVKKPIDVDYILKNLK